MSKYYPKINMLAFITIILAFGALFSVLFWGSIDRGKPFESQLLSLSPDKLVFHNGEEIDIKHNMKFLRECVVHNKRYLKNDEGFPPINYNLSEVEFKITKEMIAKKPSNYRQTFRIPQQIPKGVYNLYTKVEYSCNPLEKIIPRSYVLDNNVALTIE